MKYFADIDRIRSEAAAIRLAYVERYVATRTDRRGGDVGIEQVEEWEREAYRRWRAMFPALNGLFFAHLAEHIEDGAA